MSSDFRLKQQLPKITDGVVQTYDKVGTINHLGHCPLPSYKVIVSACEDLKEILYPGYRRREGLHSGNIMYHVGDLIDTLHDQPRSRTLNLWGKPKHCCSSNNSHNCVANWQKTSRLPTTAIRPANRSTR